MVAIRTKSEIEKITRSCSYVVEILKILKSMIKPGISTWDLDLKSRELLNEFGIKSAFLNYGNPPYPASLCTSVNEQVVHGIPSKNIILKEGDIISLDFGVECDGYFGDSAYTFMVGEVKAELKRLCDVTKQALIEGVKMACDGNRLGDISCAIQSCVESNGYSVIREFVGHGVGTHLHEDPQIPNFGKKNTGILLKSGMILAIEPMVSIGGHEIEILNDGWTAITKDRSPSAHYEHTVLVEKQEAIVLTAFN